LPKGNVVKSWEKAQKYMKLYLEDHEENCKTSSSLEMPMYENEDV
jgi:hypothetical protein